MRNIVSVGMVSLGAMMASPGAAMAQSYSYCSIWRPWNCFTSGGGSTSGTPVTTTAVPEIDASAGLLAVAAVAIVLLFVWERRRRAA